jgi:hypothetical protein
MKPSNRNQVNFESRRAELLSQIFLQDLAPDAIVTSPISADIGYDYLVVVQNIEQGTNTIAVEVKATATSRGMLSMKYATLRRLALSNLPSLLLVVDVKGSNFFYAWLNSFSISRDKKVSAKIPIQKIDEIEKKRLFDTVRKPNLLSYLASQRRSLA